MGNQSLPTVPTVAPVSPSSKPAPPPKPPVLAKALDGLVVPADQIPAATGIAPAPIQSQSQMFTAFPTTQFQDPQCAPVAFPGQAFFYEGSGWLATRVQNSWGKVSDQAPGYAWRASEFVTNFDTPKLARDFVGIKTLLLTNCENRPINAKADPPSPDDARWTAGQVDNTDPNTIMMPLSQEGGGGWRAWRALAVRNNVVLDVVIAAPDLPQSAILGLLKAITDRIDAQP